jgi:hypothetical protein
LYENITILCFEKVGTEGKYKRIRKLGARDHGDISISSNFFFNTKKHYRHETNTQKLKSKFSNFSGSGQFPFFVWEGVFLVKTSTIILHSENNCVLKFF